MGIGPKATDARFPRARFEEGVKFAMRMGAPVRPEDRATFHFRRVRTYPSGTRLDQEGKPLNPSVSATYLAPADLVLQEVAVEMEKATPAELPVGTRIPTRVVITMLEAQYQAIKARAATITVPGEAPIATGESFAYEVSLGGDRYRIGYRVPPLALFDSGIQQIVCHAMEES